MTTPSPAPSPISGPADPTPKSGLLRRAAAVVLIGLIFYAVLWITVFNAVTAALVASGGTVVLLAASSISETVQSIFEVISEAVLAIFSAIADFVSSVFE